jgi:hypothetical protein
VRVIVPILEADLMSVLVGMRPVVVGVLVDDVCMLVAYMGMIVSLPAVGVLVIVRRVMVMLCGHQLASCSLLCDLRLGVPWPTLSSTT